MTTYHPGNILHTLYRTPSAESKRAICSRALAFDEFDIIFVHTNTLALRIEHVQVQLQALVSF